MEIEFAYLSILVGTVIPILVALVTKLTASSGVKAVVNALLSAVLGVLTALLPSCTATTCSLNLRELVTSVGITWVTSVATYYGLLKPTGTTQMVGSATARVGIGSSAAK